MSDLPSVQYWLAKLDRYGNPTLIDGAHSARRGVEQAAFIFQRLGLAKGERLAVAEVYLTEVEPKSHGANEDALATLNANGLRP